MGNLNGKKGGGGGDMTLESRHLIGIFLGLVVICGVFFTLGYVMGRTQFDTSVRAEPLGKPPASTVNVPTPDAAIKPGDRTAPSTTTPSNWTFPTTGDSKKTDRLEPPPPKAAAPSKDLHVALNPAPARSAPVAKAPTASSNARMKAPAIPHGSIVLQVAALSKENDALALAKALQEKQFSAFVLQPMGDNLFRVQVGPYSDANSADAGKKALLREGFKAILKR